MQFSPLFKVVEQIRQAAWWHDPTSDRGRRENTHPVSAERLRAVARRLALVPFAEELTLG